MPITNFPNGFANGVAIRGLPLLNTYGGDVFWVDSGAGADTGKGTENSPFATLAYALDRCTASNGDLIMLKAGHAETLTATLAIDVVGVTIVGLGNGDNRPTFTVNAAVPGFNMTAHDVELHGVRIIAGSSVTAATRLMRFATDDVVVSKCRFEMAYDMYHMIVVLSGDNIKIIDCEMINTVTTNASVHPQTALLNIGGTNILVSHCRFNDTRAKKAERWRGCVEGGALASNLVVEDCTFICRGVATRTRSAAASDGTGTQSPTMATLYCRGISPSANTAVGSIFTPTCQYIVETYNVAAVNKVGVVTVTTSDIRLKTQVVYL